MMLRVSSTKPRYEASSPPLVLFSLRLLTIMVCGRSFSMSFSLKPMTWPSKPVGFGTGHSRCLLRFDVSSTIMSEQVSSVSVSIVAFLRFRLRGSPMLSSANCRRSTGQGRRCGAPTTRKDMPRHVVKRDMVDRDRGCRWATMMGGCVVVRSVYADTQYISGRRWMSIEGTLLVSVGSFALRAGL